MWRLMVRFQNSTLKEPLKKVRERRVSFLVNFLQGSKLQLGLSVRGPQNRGGICRS